MTNFEQNDLLTQHAALIGGLAFADMGDRTLVELTGGDRASFLHSFCTADIRGLTAGSGCEAFVTSAQGRVLGYVYVFCETDALVLDTVQGQAEKLMSHLERYIIREDVQLIDRTADFSALLLNTGADESQLASLISLSMPLSSSSLSNTSGDCSGIDVRVCRVPYAGAHGFLLRTHHDNQAALRQRLTAAGATMCGQEVLEAARVEAGTPVFGQDVSEKNLPQEVGRNDQAISFTKGCYLGQETVARIDALGHVNRRLVGVRFQRATVPPRDTQLSSTGKAAGHVTSAVFSPRLQMPLALAYVRRELAEPGSRFDSDVGPCDVIQLPLA